jgi:EAL domain-containing protein (putative c-di-GMP-specific phosphodiesterase class I)
VRLTDGVVVGYEALARIPSAHSFGEGVEDLFAVAQRRGSLPDLDWAARRAALHDAGGLPEDIPLFLNVSAAALLNPLHPVDQMLMLTEWGGRPPSSVVLEITERETVRDMRRLRMVVASYREHGFRFAIDDVGEGHSTLEVLATVLPEYVKIAGTITRNLSEVGARAAIDAAVAFARRTGSSQVIAEGIEDAATVTQIRSVGIELGQGYWLGVPARHPGRRQSLSA